MRNAEGKTGNVDDFDLNRTITYRHLHSTTLGVRDPLRVVALCDSDAFYAACEMVRLGVDKDTPLVVLQWDSLIAVNYPARTYGITRMAKLKDAQKMCPHLQVVHVATYKEGEDAPGYWDDVDTQTHKGSSKESAKIHTLFKDMLPGAEIEKASIDEAFIDFTRPVRAKILERYNFLASVPADAPNGLDTPLPPPPQICWDDLGNLITMAPSSTGSDVEASNATTDPVSDSHTWHDVALSIAAEMMVKARIEVHSKLGYTTSAGIARNKFLAKLSASYKKPMQQTILRNSCIPSYLGPMNFRKIRFLGGKLGKAIAQEFDASTVGDLLSIGLEEMQRKFGDNAIWVYEVLRGIDRSEVKEKSVQNKSMLASKNLPKPITKANEGHHWIRVLAAELALRLNNARRDDASLWPKTIVLHARRGYDSARSKQAPFPFVSEVTVDVIAAAGDRLWKELVGTSVNHTIRVNSVQLAFTGLETGEEGQETIEAFLKTRDHKRPRESLEFQTIGTEPPSIVVRNQVDVAKDDGRSFICPRCGTRISLPTSVAIADASAEVVNRETALDKLRMEHADFHYAQDLVRVKPIRPSASYPRQQTSSKRKKGHDSVGITKYFDRI